MDAGFGNTAQKLARNPLGIIALFIVLIYGFAALVVGMTADNFQETSLLAPMIWFLVIFPVLVLGTFGWLVSRHHTKLYSPRDFQDDDNFLAAIDPTLSRLPSAQAQSEEEEDRPAPQRLGGGRGSVDVAAVVPIAPAERGTPEGRLQERTAFYESRKRLFMVHALQPSKTRGQEYDVFIYVLRHGREPIDDIDRAQFFFGKSWGSRIFEGQREGNIIGVTTSAYGPFLCTCLVTLRSGEQIMLHRYVDFEMGPPLKKALQLATGSVG